MLIAAIIFGAGVLIELYAVLLAPMGYQDERGFHAMADRGDDESRTGAQNPS
jgi:hypothetical protein